MGHQDKNIERAKQKYTFYLFYLKWHDYSDGICDHFCITVNALTDGLPCNLSLMNIHLPATHLSAHPSLPGKHHLVSCWESWSNLGGLLSRTKAAQCTQQCSGLIPGLQVPLSALCSPNTWGSILPGTTSQVSSIFQEALLADLHKFEPGASKQSKPQNLREKLTLLYSKHMLFLAHTWKHSKN